MDSGMDTISEANSALYILGGDLQKLTHIPLLDNPYETKGLTVQAQGLEPTISGVSMNFFDVEKYCAKPPKGKVGRRGDPRMHRALKARLDNPHMTLLDALLEGGFSFPNMDVPGLSDRVIRDDDGVSLCQRKNQLMRRLRGENVNSAKSTKQSSKQSRRNASADKQKDVPKEGSLDEEPKGQGVTTSAENASKKNVKSGHSQSPASQTTLFKTDTPKSTSYHQGFDPSSPVLASLKQRQSQDSAPHPNPTLSSSLSMPSLRRQSQDSANHHQRPTLSSALSIPTYLQGLQHSWMPSGIATSHNQSNLASFGLVHPSATLGTGHLPQPCQSSVEQTLRTHQARQVAPSLNSLSTTNVAPRPAAEGLDTSSVPTAEELTDAFAEPFQTTSCSDYDHANGGHTNADQAMDQSIRSLLDELMRRSGGNIN